jgi:hypothetical protein
MLKRGVKTEHQEQRKRQHSALIPERALFQLETALHRSVQEQKMAWSEERLLVPEVLG